MISNAGDDDYSDNVNDFDIGNDEIDDFTLIILIICGTYLSTDTGIELRDMYHRRC